MLSTEATCARRFEFPSNGNEEEAMISRILLPALVLGIASSVAGARPMIVHETETVSYADLDLTSSEGEKVFHRRVLAAIARACAPDDRAVPAPPLPDSRCFGSTLRSIRAKMDQAIAGARTSDTLASAHLTDSK
jgi:UrcA family protein